MTWIIDVVGLMGTGTLFTLWAFAQADRLGILKGTLTGEIVGEGKAKLRQYREEKKKNEYELKV